MHGREEGGGWAPLRAAESFLGTPRSDVQMTPLSQMPVPQAQESPTPAWMARPTALLEDEDEEAEETWGDVMDEPEDEDEIAPITRASLRLECGLPKLDAYAGTMLTGGAYAPGEMQQHPGDEARLGFPLGSALEIVGPPGIGKTTWALQMAIGERMHHILHSLDLALDELGSQLEAEQDAWDEWLDANVVPWCAQAVLVGTSTCSPDTEGSIVPERIVQMARSTVQKHLDAPSVVRWMSACGASDTNRMRPSLERCVLQGLHVVRATSLGDLLAFLGVAASSVLKVPGLPPRTSLLVVDSISFLLHTHAQASREQRKSRADALANLVQALTTLRDFYIPEHDRLTVITTAQMATRMPGDRRTAEAGIESVLVPSLGNTTAPAMRGSFDTSAYDWGTSLLGRSAWRFLLFYHGAQAARYVVFLTQPRLYPVAARVARGAGE